MNFIDLQEQYRRYKDEIRTEMDKVLESAMFIKGPALAEFEEMLAEHSGVKHAVGCSSGTDALVLGLLAKGMKPGDEVIVPDFTFIATAETVSLMGGVPVFADVQEDTLNIDPADIEKKITAKTVGIIPVSLYGQCADFDEIQAIADKNNVWVMEDGAQSYGAEYKGRKSCSITEIATTSFFPAKPLGAYGDGGAVFTNDDETADFVRMYLNHGQEKRYRHKVIGTNARLDALQAAILKVKLRHFDDEVEARQKVAGWYTAKLRGVVETPTVRDYNKSVWAQYTVRVENREDVISHLKSKNIPTAIHYPVPLHAQEAFAVAKAPECPVSKRASGRVFSLPMHPFMTEEQVDEVVSAIKEAVK
ncbi:MAG: DegT/DnrJ/EryC1/StrS family aminotransferase [Spirochaetia bacterium]